MCSGNHGQSNKVQLKPVNLSELDDSNENVSQRIIWLQNMELCVADSRDNIGPHNPRMEQRTRTGSNRVWRIIHLSSTL